MTLMALLCGVGALCGCTITEPSHSDGSDISWPDLFVHPNWGCSNIIVYCDYGVVEVNHETGSHQLDPQISGLWVYDISNDIKRRIVDHGNHPALSPNCEYVAYDSNGSIFTVGLQDSVINIIMQSGSNSNPIWSEDGDWILYEHNNNVGNGSSIWRTCIESCVAEEIISTWGSGSCKYPVFIDTCEIWFTYHAGYGEGDYPSEIYKYDITKDEITRITSTPARESKITYNYNNQFVLVEAHSSGMPYFVNQVDIRSGRSTPYIESAYWPSLSPDGDKFVYMASSGGSLPVMVLWIYDIATGRTNELLLRNNY